MKILDNLRKLMVQSGFDYYVVEDSDAHSSEYVNDYYKFRTVLSGFTGSNGTLIIGIDDAYLFTDGRYFIQAEIELEGSGIKLMKMNTPGFPSLKEFIVKQISDGKRVVCNGFNFSYKNALNYAIKEFDNDNSLFLNAYQMTYGKNYPSLVYDKTTVILDESLAGESYESKIEKVRNNLIKENKDLLIVSALDSCMWLLNIRGRAIQYNPVTFCYLVISKEDVLCFIDSDNLSELKNVYKKVSFYGYDEFSDYVSSIKNKDVLFEYSSFAAGFADRLIINGNNFLDSDLNISLEKAVKNQTEIMNIKRVYKKDSYILNEFLKFVKEIDMFEFDEYTLGQKLDVMRLADPDCYDLSFDTISASGPNAAMMHYSATSTDKSKILNNSLYLVDSGGQWNGGTTDVTRTVSVGVPSYEMKHDYTLVLRGLLHLQNCVFLEGVTGLTLDMCARGPLWNEGIDYKCGTGHGIGYMLNVHEGPQSIRPRSQNISKEVSFKPGMIVSDEPGVYKEGKYGIRLENILLCVEKYSNSDGKFLGFEPLTFVPFDEDLIIRNEMNHEELKWLDDYQNKCKEILLNISQNG